MLMHFDISAVAHPIPRYDCPVPAYPTLSHRSQVRRRHDNSPKERQQKREIWIMIRIYLGVVAAGVYLGLCFCPCICKMHRAISVDVAAAAAPSFIFPALPRLRLRTVALVYILWLTFCWQICKWLNDWKPAEGGGCFVLYFILFTFIRAYVFLHLF